jgi:DNA topoisomerase IA
VVEAILHPLAFDNNIIDAQEARRALDRVVGYEASPLLWKRFSVCKLSAGRVQSAALKMIIDRFSAHESHSYSKEWYLEGKFSLEGWDDVLEANLVKSVKDTARITWTDEAKVEESIRSFPKGGGGGVWTIDISQRRVSETSCSPHHKHITTRGLYAS